MSEQDDKLIAAEEPSQPPRPHRSMRYRLRRFFLRHLPLAVAFTAISLALLAVGLYFVASSSAFENGVRKRLIASIEELTGGRAEIASFHWRLLHFEAEADGVVIHGLEDPGEAPYAKIDHLRVVFSLRNLFSPTVRLRSLEIDRPSLHFIVYPNGSTNQPHPRQPRNSSNPAIDTLFEMQAGRIAVEQGSYRLRLPQRKLRLSGPERAARLFGQRCLARHALCSRDVPYARVLSHRSWRHRSQSRPHRAAQPVAGARSAAGHARPGARAGISALSADHGREARRPKTRS